MLNSLKSLTLATSMTAALLATSAQAEMQDISEIKVSASYNAAEDANAASLFPDISTDIMIAIAERVPQSNNAADPIIRVDIRKVALNGDTILPDSAEFNQLEGIVAIDTKNNAVGRTFPVKIHAMSGNSMAPEGYVSVPPSLDDFYQAMVAAFADNVAEGLAKVAE